MFDAWPVLLVLIALIVGSVLYGLEVARRVHERRIEERLRSSAQLYGRVRVALAQRRGT